MAEKVNQAWTFADVARLSDREIYGKTLVSLGTTNKNIVVLGSDLMYSNRTSDFLEKFPERAFNFGVAEQNMMGAAAGFATCGKIVFVSTFAAFASMRACEQVRTDICYPNLNVKIVATHSGLTMGSGGTTHHATEDIAIVRSFANLTVIVPADAIETEKAVRAAVEHEGPVYIRLGRAAERLVFQNGYPYDFKIGKAITLKSGKDVTLIATGLEVYESIIASDILGKKGIDVGVINMHTIKPIDEETIINAAQNSKLLVTVEEHNVIGGLGSAVCEVVAEKCPVRVLRIGIPDVFTVIGSPEDLKDRYGLTGDKIAEKIISIL